MNPVKNNPLRQLDAFGQSIWLDYIRRDLIAGGGLRRLIEEDGLRGMISNPSIFEKAIVESHDYDADIRDMAVKGKIAQEIYEAISQRDVQSAADLFRPLYVRTDGADGYVSLEVVPHLARDTKGTIAEARRLWLALDRPNVFIKVPATLEGLPAIRQLVSEGININAYRDHGDPQARLEQRVDEAVRLLNRLPALGIDLDALTQQLEDEGVEKFNEPFDKLVAALAQRSIADEGQARSKGFSCRLRGWFGRRP